MNKKTTQPTKQSQIKRAWHLVDLKDKILGRASVGVAYFLMGKGKPYFVKNLDCGDHVVVINAKHVKTTGKKETQKVYTRYSGYPGGLKKEVLKDLRQRRPDEVIRHAVYGMLPKNKLRDRMLTRLFIFPDLDHPYKNRFKQE